MIRHAGLIALRLGGRWRGALIEGPSGSGKSDLALRALDCEFRVISDDRTVIWVSEGRLFGRAPSVLEGLMEVRGVGIVQVPTLRFSEIDLLVRAGEPERLPDADEAELLGVRLPRLTLAYAEASAPAKLGRAMGALYLGGQRRM